jgi:hypothetical protein
MNIYKIKTRALMEQTYNIEAEDEKDARRIALDNTKDIVEQTQVGEGEILSVEEI